MALEIVSLRDKKEMADICASWSFSQWGSQLAGERLEDRVKRYRDTAASSGTYMPATWVALENNVAVGMASLKNDDHPDITDLNPWLASVYVHPYHRGQGIAGKLLERVEREARDAFGFDRLYLFTGEARALYEKHGWSMMRKVRDPLGLSPEGDNLMMKELV